MNVLILTGKFGMGHTAVAQALQEEIREKYPNAHVVCTDIFEYIMPEYAEGIYKAFSVLAKSGNSLYNRIYKQTNHRNGSVPSVWCAFFKKKLEQLFSETQPDVIFSTLPLCSRLVSWYKDEVDNQYTLVTCITDISSHEEWIHKNTNYYLVGSKVVKRMLLMKGVYEEKIFVTGIPVRKAFDLFKEERDYEKKDKIVRGKKERKRKLLVMGGGLGLLPKKKNFYEGLNALDGVRTTVITGRNVKLYKILKGRYENVDVVQYTNEIANYMKNADVILTKPGGISVFEAISCEKPLLLFQPFLQQEVNNMRFVLRNNIGQVVSAKEQEGLEIIQKTIQDDAELQRMETCIGKLKEQFDSMALPHILERVEKGLIAGKSRNEGDWVS